MKKGTTKQEFIEKYSELLKMTREGIDRLELADSDTVIIYFIQGYGDPIKVNIACDGGMGIIRDVAKSIH